MIARIVLTTLTLVAVGCGATEGPHLQFVEMQIDEQTFPLPFVIELRNVGDVDAPIGEISARVLQKTLISRSVDAGREPSGFDYAVEVRDGHPTTIGAGEAGVACGFLRWKLPADPPPMLAVLRCDFVVHYGEDRTVDSEPTALVLQSQAGVLKSMLESPGSDGHLTRAQAAEVLNVISAIPGRRSDGLLRLISRLESISRSPQD